MSDDLISRQAALDNAHRQLWYRMNQQGIKDRIDEWLNNLPSADRPSGFWTKTDVATYKCSECGKKQIADDDNELNYCCCCGSRNRVRRKGAE